MPEGTDASEKPKRVTALAFYRYLDRYRGIFLPSLVLRTMSRTNSLPAHSSDVSRVSLENPLEKFIRGYELLSWLRSQ